MVFCAHYYAVYWNPTFWGEDGAGEFRPERWLLQLSPMSCLDHSMGDDAGEGGGGGLRIPKNGWRFFREGNPKLYRAGFCHDRDEDCRVYGGYGV